MNPLHRVAAAVVVAVSGVLTLTATAQTPPTPGAPPATPPQTKAAPARPAAIAAPAPAPAPLRRRSIVHHYPYPYPAYYENDATAGFRNPGGVGRYLEYYPPGNHFQLDQGLDPVRVATFGRGSGAPDFAQQMQAHQIGTQRYNAIQQHIDNYARPYMGYGFGVGYFGGFF